MESSSKASNNKQEVLGMQVFDCTVCSKPLRPPVFKCPNGSFICHDCWFMLPKSEKFAAHSCSSMERVVENIFVPCKHGCNTKIKYYEKKQHEQTCHLGPCTCPLSGCGIAMSTEGLFDHLTTLHKLPSVDIKYFVPFEHPVESGTCVLRGNFSRLFLLDVAQAAAVSPEHAISLTCLQVTSVVGCLVCFSCKDGHYQYSKCDIRPDGVSTQRLCVVPKVSAGQTDVVLSITIELICSSGDLVDEDDDDDSYDVNDEDLYCMDCLETI